MKKIAVLLLFVSTLVCAEVVETEYDEQAADCLILKDENSIICKYTHERKTDDMEVVFEWIDPNGELSRKREMLIPAGHGSVYDFRYISGRMKGTWTFKVIDNDKVLSTTFELE